MNEASIMYAPLAPLPAGPLSVLHVFPTFAVGGAQVRFAALANRWGSRWRHAILSLDGRFDCAERLSVAHERVVFAPVRGESFPSRLLRIRGTLQRLRPDVLVTSNWGAIEWAIANVGPPRIPHLHTEDGFGPDEATGQKRRRIMARRLALRFSTTVVPSRVLHHAAREVWRLPDRRLRFVPNGLDTTRFHAAGPRVTWPVADGGPVIGTVAALRPEKNVARLIRAAGRLRRDGVALRLAIIGDGGERGSLEALARTEGVGDSAMFCGHMPDPAAAYRAMDVFALSSDTEQMPFSVLEAMASGLPIAATEVGDLRAMLAEPNLPHLAALDEVALAQALRPLLLDRELRSRLGAANRAKVEREYDQERMFAAYAALIEQRHRPIVA